MKNKERIQTITGLSILIGLAIALTFLSNYIPTGVVNINLVLIVIVIAACIYGPIGGAVIGFVNGVIMIFAPGTLTVFMPYNPLVTILLCITKTTVAGIVSGLIFKLLSKKKDFLASVLSSIVVPIVNTGIFIIGATLFFLNIEFWQGSFTKMITSILTINFLIEFVSIVILSPAIYRIIKVITTKMNENRASAEKEAYEEEVDRIEEED